MSHYYCHRTLKNLYKVQIISTRYTAAARISIFFPIEILVLHLKLFQLRHSNRDYDDNIKKNRNILTEKRLLHGGARLPKQGANV